ncbi:hypothetical protein Nepgr_021119 [Nepenthes gracilis]|uniref:Uncharacterized protein n=1 Tax=Nepenthes gracilis TaxID=150966 RepID=A0AAD3SWB7_NEPGR|nr:hypothetical protein Nepgr_021119 [Nepenthes gracilis]
MLMFPPNLIKPGSRASPTMPEAIKGAPRREAGGATSDQANQAEILAEVLAEETEGVLEFGVVGEEMVFTDVEPQGTVPQAGAPSSEVEVEVPVVPACEAQAPETSGEASVGGDLLISQLHDVAGGPEDYQ